MGGVTTSCNHVSCGNSEKVWLTHTYQGRECGLKPHNYCLNCGLVMNLSSDKPRSVGYYMNVLSALSKEVKIAKIQMRLICLKMQGCKLDDGYGLSRYQQEKIFVDIVMEYLNVPEWKVQKFL